MKVRLTEIARRAGVSVSTVSRVLNDKPGVAESTRQAVLTALDVAEPADGDWAAALESVHRARFGYARAAREMSGDLCRVVHANNLDDALHALAGLSEHLDVRLDDGIAVELLTVHGSGLEHRALGPSQRVDAGCQVVRYQHV